MLTVTTGLSVPAVRGAQEDKTPIRASNITT